MPVIGSDYELARRERNAKREPNQVVMGGEQFTLLPTIPISAGFDLADAPEPKAGDTMEAEAIRALCSFIRLALVDEDQPRFDALLERRTDAIDGADVIYYGSLIAEVYAGRPTVPSSGSSGGRHTRGATSKKPGRKAS
ncbi:MAG: hypothetical protein ACSLFP_10455 [Acidimicrobiales bacterium]